MTRPEGPAFHFFWNPCSIRNVDIRHAERFGVFGQTTLASTAKSIEDVLTAIAALMKMATSRKKTWWNELHSYNTLSWSVTCP
jgi:hypothetical protein